MSTGGEAPKFIVDQNVGKLARWLRMMGYDTAFFCDENDSLMVRRALLENRIILTKDSGILQRHAVTTGRIRAVLITSDEPLEQIEHVIEALGLDCYHAPFSRCLECNRLLEERSREEVKDRVPPYVFKTREQYMECPGCRRIYWRGTHWEHMMRRLEEFCNRAGREQ